MKKPVELDRWNIPDLRDVQDGYYITQIPDLTIRNFNQLLESHNNLVEIINVLCQRLGVELDDENAL